MKNSITAPPSAPVGVEASYHPCTSILIEGLKRLEGGSDVLAEWDRARAKTDTALAQQPAAAGEEIMVNAAHDVYTLPLRPSGLSSGPRFVVHVPAPEQQPAAPVLAKHQPCGCVICTCEDEQQCQGCGAKHCGNRADHPPYVGQQPAAVDGEVDCRCIDCGGNQPGHDPTCSYMHELHGEQPAAVDEPIVEAVRHRVGCHDGLDITPAQVRSVLKHWRIESLAAKQGGAK